MTAQIATLQDTSDRACSSDTSVFECSRACASTLDEQMSAIEWVSKKYLGPCKNYNFKFTNVFEQMRTDISVPKSGTCGYSNRKLTFTSSCLNWTTVHRWDHMRVYRSWRSLQRVRGMVLWVLQVFTGPFNRRLVLERVWLDQASVGRRPMC